MALEPPLCHASCSTCSLQPRSEVLGRMSPYATISSKFQNHSARFQRSLEVTAVPLPASAKRLAFSFLCASSERDSASLNSAAAASGHQLRRGDHNVLEPICTHPGTMIWRTTLYPPAPNLYKVLHTLHTSFGLGLRVCQLHETILSRIGLNRVPSVSVKAVM